MIGTTLRTSCRSAKSSSRSAPGAFGTSLATVDALAKDPLCAALELHPSVGLPCAVTGWPASEVLLAHHSVCGLLPTKPGKRSRVSENSPGTDSLG